MTINTEKPLHILAAGLWQREGGHCVSSLVHTLALGWCHVDLNRDARDLRDLAEQAFELSTPIDDWESAAREAGWDYNPDGEVYFLKDSRIYRDVSGWLHLCEIEDIEPHQHEVYEHWIVSDWLADQLAERGEKVDKDFAGLTIWARTTTGQAVYADGVIEDIARPLHA